MYEEQLGEGEDYSKIKRTVCINILNFKYLKTTKFHTGYRLKEMETHEELTDIIEMHFIEVPKLEENSDEKDMLVAWTEFLKNPESEKVRHLEMDIEEIRSAKDELIRLSNDEKEREIYEMRSKILKDKVSALNNAERNGDINRAKVGIRNMLAKGMDTKSITEILEISVELVEEVIK
ncbi:Rpn family recombination-promoting nuclease/putative transposase [Clostridium gasigenes]|uniref:Rpn family recombination-promoting nuclease/putative transposase n=1 Tax=Clostridium gasigenes TaxID=94869 RepID=UPI00209B5C4A|nr:Rpn family recombination-promoting nuclease/putative transposase [Clostridium gasigenes]